MIKVFSFEEPNKIHTFVFNFLKTYDTSHQAEISVNDNLFNSIY